ncbi:MAG: ABC transporter ATP-binding protein [Propionibacteriaceae bacterium]|nr:ABC transporter ATP-binding protein [Micropruina sp.]
MNESTLAIAASGLTKSYGSLTAVDALDLSVPAGQILALLGPNGAGKSTTTEMILGLTRPDAGELRVLGAPPVEAVRRGEVGAMLQNGTLLADVTVQRLLTLVQGMHAHPLPLAEVIERANVAPILRSTTTKLSGGEAQRVRFALAILPDPRLILLDEPTVGMDVDARRHFWSVMGDLAAEGRTILFATHYLDEADEFADRIVVINKGRVIADGTGTDIKATVGGRLIAFNGPHRDYSTLPGVVAAAAHGDRFELNCFDSDLTLRALIGLPDVRGIEVTSPSLEDAFLKLVA